MFTCTSVNMVYCICCSRCGLLYIDETKWRLGDRFVEHLHSVRDKRQHLLVANHFNNPSHSLGDMSILLQCLFQCHNDAAHKLEEQHLILVCVVGFVDLSMRCYLVLSSLEVLQSKCEEQQQPLGDGGAGQPAGLLLFLRDLPDNRYLGNGAAIFKQERTDGQRLW
eukprot:g45069.t1